MNFSEILNQQKIFFRTQATKNIEYRKESLKKLKTIFKQNEALLYEAIYKDFRKSEFDTFSTELAFFYDEIDFYLKKLSTLAKPKKVKTNLLNQLGKSKIYSEPYGNCLIIGAWNYPYLLSLVPMVSAIAAGNTVILKPSEISYHSALAMQKIMTECFTENYITVICGGVEETTKLLELKFDHIFFTGSTKVGKIIYQAAAKHLTPVVLELGGKSPAIVTANANLDVAARRIVWGKFLNAGQTCIAPDYLLVDQKIKPQLIEKLKQEITKANYTHNAEHYCNIINARNFERLTQYILPEKITYGGNADAKTLYIEPTLMDNVTWEDDIMQDEIFGPILPILSYINFDETLDNLLDKDKPLSAYLFSDDGFEKQKFATRFSFGGGCINDTLMHIINPHLPFGGVGGSGMGNYHGKFGFDTFSHKKSILEKANWGEPNWKYPPYTDSKKGILNKLL